MAQKFRANDSPLLLSMVVVTLTFLAIVSWAFFCSVVKWMVLKFLPSVTHIATEMILTSINRVVINQILDFPVGASLNKTQFTIG